MQWPACLHAQGTSSLLESPHVPEGHPDERRAGSQDWSWKGASLQVSLLLVQFEQVLICHRVEPSYVAVPLALQERIDIESYAGNSCMLHVEFQCILCSCFGRAGMPCVDTQESLDKQR